MIVCAEMHVLREAQGPARLSLARGLRRAALAGPISVVSGALVSGTALLAVASVG